MRAAPGGLAAWRASFDHRPFRISAKTAAALPVLAFASRCISPSASRVLRVFSGTDGATLAKVRAGRVEIPRDRHFF